MSGSPAPEKPALANIIRREKAIVFIRRILRQRFTAKQNKSRAILLATSALRKGERDERGRGQAEQEHDEIDDPADKKFKERHEPALTVNSSNREQDLQDR